MARNTVVTTTLDHGAIARMLTRISSKSALKAATKTQERVRANITSKGRVNTGKMLRSVDIVPILVGTLSNYAVQSTLDYTGYQEGGIKAVHARPGHVLRFKPKGSNVFIFRPRTRGFEGGHFFRDAQRAIRLSDFF